MSDWEEDEDSITVLPLSAYFPGKLNVVYLSVTALVQMSL